MNLSEFIKQPLMSLQRISPSRYFPLQQCLLKDIWVSSQEPLLPFSPSAKLGTVIHEMVQLAFQNRINNESEFEKQWESVIKRLETKMIGNPVEKHLVPLETSAFNFEVKKFLVFKMISPLFGNISNTKVARPKTSAEKWVQTPDGKIGGKIDLIKDSSQGVEIVDFKTGILSEENSPGNAKEEYIFQIKMYAALYHAQYSIWPVKLTLEGLNQESFSVAVDSDECSRLLHDAKKMLNDTNELIEAGLNPEDFAQPSPNACKFCLYRPACNKYWEKCVNDKSWPADERGRIRAKTMLANGTFRILVETASRDIAIRGLSPERHSFLNEEVQEILFCNLGHDTLEDHYLERMLTTGYAVK